jgi:hypothetical protein
MRTTTLDRPRRAPEQLSDRELAIRYWTAHRELDALRCTRSEQIALEGPGQTPRRIAELDALCERIWNECRRRAVAAELLAA